MGRKHKAIAVMLLVAIVFSWFSVVPEAANAASDPRDINPPLGAEVTIGGDPHFSTGFWSIYVDGRRVGDALALAEDYWRGSFGDTMNMLHQSTLNSWANTFTPIPTATGYYEGATFSKQLGSFTADRTVIYNGRSSPRMHIRDLADQLGAQVSYNSSKKEVYVTTSKFPTGAITYPEGLREGDKITFQLRGTAYSTTIDRYSFSIGGSPVKSGRPNINSFSDSVTHTLSAGQQELRLEITDSIGRTTTYRQYISPAGKPAPPPEPPKPDPPVGRPVADFTMPSMAADWDPVRIKNTSKPPKGGRLVDAEWEVSTSRYDGELGFDGGTIYFERPNRTYDVTLTVWDNNGMSDSITKSIFITEWVPPDYGDDPEPEPEPQLQPPWADFELPEEVYQGETVEVVNTSTDPDGEIVENKWSIDIGDRIEDVWDSLGNDEEPPLGWTLTPGMGVNGALDDAGGTIVFPEEGIYTVTLRVVDNDGLWDIRPKTIIVLPAVPKAYFNWTGTPKENRKMVLDATQSFTPEIYPIDWTKTEWEIEPPEGIDADNIKIVTSADLSKRTLLFKQAGDYTVRLRVTNSGGLTSEWYEETLTIYPDEPPVADFFVMESITRDPAEGNRAKIELNDLSYSPDGDIISKRVWKYRYDSNNDGSFDDETWVILDDGNNPSPVLLTDQVGKYEFSLEIEEEFGQDTIPQFITHADRKTANTFGKPLEERTTEVINIRPVVGFEVIVKPQADIVLHLVTDKDNMDNTFTSAANDMVNKLQGAGIDVKKTVKTEGPSVETSSVLRNEIYFQASRYPYDTDHMTSTNYDYKAHIGDFERIMRYSSGGGSNEFNNLTIYVHNLEPFVPIDKDTPSVIPKLFYSIDGQNWNSLSLTFTGITNDWFYTDTGEYASKEYRFRSNTITSDVQYIKVTGPSGSYSSNIVRVVAYAYGNQYHTQYPSLNDSVFVEDLSSLLWRDLASKYVVLVSNRPNQISNHADIIAKYTMQNVKIIFVGTSSLKDIGESLANSTGGKFFQYDGANIPWIDIEQHIADELLQARQSTQTVLLGQQVEIKTYYSDTETDPKYQERWMYDHNPSYYDNSLGLASFHNQYIPTPITSFDKVGQFDVIYQARDNPKDDNRFDEYRLWSYMPLDKLTLNVHRRPVAEFSFTLTRSGTNYNVSFQIHSYDLDHEVSRHDKGIVAQEWKWKEVSAATWNEGQPTVLQAGKQYLVSLRVLDPEGVWSHPNVKVIAPGSNLPPIAMFTVHPNPLPLGDTLSYEDYSYDPNGYPLTEWAWRYKRPDGTWVDNGSKFPSNVYNTLGTYEIELRVKNSQNRWSEPYYQTVEVIAQNRPPVARFTVSPNPLPLDVSPTYKDESYDPDGDPIVAWEWQYQKNGGSWINGQPTGFDAPSLGIGNYNIRLRVKDQPALAQMTPLWSEWYTQALQVIAGNQPPVAMFTVSPNPVPADEPVTYNDSSYDPEGLPLAERVWQVRKPDGTVLGEYRNQLPPRVFETTGWGEHGDGVGTFIIALQVKDQSPNGISPAKWSEWYTQTLVVEDPLSVIGDTDYDTYMSGQAMLLNAYTEGRAYKVEAKVWFKNKHTDTDVTQLIPVQHLDNPPQKEMEWRTRRFKDDPGGRDLVVIIPPEMPDGLYQVEFTAYKESEDGTIKTAHDTITVRVEGVVYDRSYSQIIGGPR